MARLRSGRRSHKQDQLNSDGIPEFLDFFSRGTGSSNPSPSSAESRANLTSSTRAPILEIGDDAVAQRPDRLNVARGAAEH
jgi:hypothetical protein